MCYEMNGVCSFFLKALDFFALFAEMIFKKNWYQVKNRLLFNFPAFFASLFSFHLYGLLVGLSVEAILKRQVS